MTALPACIAEDLDADWAKVKVVTAPDNETLFGNPKFFDHMVTVGSRAVAGYYEKVRLAGAQARKVLLVNAAQAWKVPVEELSTEPGQVVHKKSGRKISYGALAKDAKVPDPLPAVSKADLKPLNQCRLHRQGRRAGRYPAQGQWRGQIRHRYPVAGHTLCFGAAPAGAGREGRQGRRQRGARRSKASLPSRPCRAASP